MYYNLLLQGDSERWSNDGVMIQVRIVLKRTVVGDWHFSNTSKTHLQSGQVIFKTILTQTITLYELLILLRFKPFTMETVLEVGCFFQSGCTNCIYSNWRSKVLKPQRCSYPTPKPIPTFIPWPRHASFYKFTNFGSGLTRVCVLINYIYLVNNWCICSLNLWTFDL